MYVAHSGLGHGTVAGTRCRQLVVPGWIAVAVTTLLGLCHETNAVAAVPSGCNDDTVRAAFHGDANTSLISVRAIGKGARLSIDSARSPVAVRNDLCLVKILVGPGTTKEPDHNAPSWSAGIGIEIWLPTPAAWNQRLRTFGGGGWAGGSQRRPDRIGSPAQAILAADLGFATASTDTGHEPVGDISYAFLSNGKLNAEALHDFIERSLVELAVKSKALVNAYYGMRPRYSYFEGGSQGGRQGLEIAEKHPELYDGYLVGYPGINGPRFGVAAVYPQIVLRKELGFTSIDKTKTEAFLKKADAVSALAVKTCDKEHLGFLLDPFSCNYDPLKDPAALCAGVSGHSGVIGVNADAATCMNAAEAGAMDRIWYGETTDGSWDPDQTAAERGGARLGPRQVWWGPNRGAPLYTRIRNAYTDNLVQALDRVDMAADASATGFAPLKNASTSVRNRWLELDYADLARASDSGMASAIYSPYATDQTDLSKLKASGAKVLIHLGLADEYIPPAGNLYWFQKVAGRMGGFAQLGQYMRLYVVPSALHNDGRAYVPGGDAESVPLPGQIGESDGHELQDGQLFLALMQWVEHGAAPQQLPVTSGNGQVSYPLCVYPEKTTWIGKDMSHQAKDFVCR